MCCCGYFFLFFPGCNSNRNYYYLYQAIVVAVETVLLNCVTSLCFSLLYGTTKIEH